MNCWEVPKQRAPYHPLNVQILTLLQKEGYIRGFVVENNKISILLKHYQGAPVIRQARSTDVDFRVWDTEKLDEKGECALKCSPWISDGVSSAELCTLAQRAKPDLQLSMP